MMAKVFMVDVVWLLKLQASSFAVETEFYVYLFIVIVNLARLEIIKEDDYSKTRSPPTNKKGRPFGRPVKESATGLLLAAEHQQSSRTQTTDGDGRGFRASQQNGPAELSGTRAEDRIAGGRRHVQAGDQLGSSDITVSGGGGARRGCAEEGAGSKCFSRSGVGGIPGENLNENTLTTDSAGQRDGRASDRASRGAHGHGVCQGALRRAGKRSGAPEQTDINDASRGANALRGNGASSGLRARSSAVEPDLRGQSVLKGNNTLGETAQSCGC